MAFITVGLDENKVYNKAQPPGGHCSDWIPTSPPLEPAPSRRSQPPPYCPEWRQEQEPQPHYPRKERRLSAGNPATNNQNYGSTAPAAVELRPPSLHRKIQRQATTSGDYGPYANSVDEMLEHNSALAKGVTSRFGPSFESSDRGRTPRGLLRIHHNSTGQAQVGVDGDRGGKRGVPPGGHSTALW